MDDFEQYEQLRDTGESSLAVYLRAKDNGVDKLTLIRMLRSVFELSLEEAKKVSFKGDTGVDFKDSATGNVKEYEDILDDELGLDD